MPRILFITFLFLFSQYAFTQQSEYGYPFITTYSPSEYGAKEDSWSVVQDSRGVMYFANQSGILEFDGTGWNLIPLKNNKLVNALAIDSSGTIYAGGTNEMGYLRKTIKGSLEYVSFSDEFPGKIPDFLEIQRIIIDGEDIYFQDYNYIFRINKQGFSIYLHSDNDLGRLFYDNGRFLLNKSGTGLCEIKDRKLIPLLGGDKFKDDRVLSFLKINSKGYILISEQGLYLYNHSRFERFDTEADEFLIQYPIVSSAALGKQGNKERFALGTLGSGLFIIDEDGKLVHHLTKNDGLNNDFVLSLFVDDQDGLWCTHMIGISRIDISGSLSIIDKRLGVDTFCFLLQKHGNKIYAATLDGLLEQEKQGFDDSRNYIRFRKNSDIFVDCRSLLAVDNGVLVGGINGVYLYKNGSAAKVSDAYAEYLYRSKIDSDIVFVGETGLSILRMQPNGKWMHNGRVSNFIYQAHFITEDKDSSVWVMTMSNGMYRIKGIFSDSEPVIKRYGIEEGLPSLSFNEVSTINNKALIGFEYGLYSYNQQTDKFTFDSLFHHSFEPPLPRVNLELREMPDGNIWVVNNSNKGLSGVNYYVRQPDGIYKKTILNATERLNKKGVHIPRNQNTAEIWFTNNDGLFSYSVSEEFVNDFPANAQSGRAPRIRSVMFMRNDSLLYGGNRINEGLYEISYENNSLSFEAAGMQYNATELTMFRYRMEGLDEEWSSWSYDTRKEYPNLRAGNYVFHVQSLLPSGETSKEASYSFVILPPYWGTWWFGTLIALFAVALIFGGSRLVYQKRITALEREQKQHEEFSRMLIESQEKERQRIASDLHDSIGQNILVIKNQAQIGEQRHSNIEEKNRDLLNIAKIAAESLEEVRSISHNLRPIHLEEFGLKDTLQALVSNVQKISDIDINLIMGFDEGKIPSEYEINIYRIIQESLSNILKYSDAKNALIQVSQVESKLEIAINDDGKGTDNLKEGFGIAGMRERLKIMGGELLIETKKGEGTRLKGLIPLSS